MIAQASVSGAPSARLSVTYAQSVVGGYPKARASLMLSQAAVGGYPRVRAAMMFVQCIHPYPEEIMVSSIFPGFGNDAANNALPAGANTSGNGFPGIAFSWHKKPLFNTRVSESASFNSIRNPVAPYPRWQFELTYGFLEDNDTTESQIKEFMGFFLGQQGKALPFLFKDPDDYLVSRGIMWAGDGATEQFNLVRYIGSAFYEPIGQVDQTNPINFYFALTETHAVPSAGPYTVAVAHAAAFDADMGVVVAGAPLVKVAGSPASGQYSEAAGVYTFNSVQASASAAIKYRYLTDPSTWSIVLPNKVVFSAAPPTGAQIYADFQFFFTCYFDDDQLDFEKFLNQLWQLQKVAFHSELLSS